MKPGLIVRIMPTSKRALSWVGVYGITTNIIERGDISIRVIHHRSKLDYFHLWVEPNCLEIT